MRNNTAHNRKESMLRVHGIGIRTSAWYSWVCINDLPKSRDARRINTSFWHLRNDIPQCLQYYHEDSITGWWNLVVGIELIKKISKQLGRKFIDWYVKIRLILDSLSIVIKQDSTSYLHNSYTVYLLHYVLTFGKSVYTFLCLQFGI